MQFPSELRLHSLPWRALAGLADELVPALAEVLAGQKAESVLSRFLRARRGLDADGRRAVAEAVFGVGLWRRRLAWHAGVEEPSPEHARVLLFCLLRDLGGLPAQDAANLTGHAGEAALPRAPPPPTDLAHRFSMPDWLVQTLRDSLPRNAEDDELSALADALNLPGPVTLRTNTLRTTRDELQQALAAQEIQTKQGTYARDTALHVVTPRPNILGLAEHQSGHFETQDEGSQLLGALVEAKPGERVLDLCAGAGGKSLQLAAQLQNRGELHVYDPDLSRLERLEIRARKAGVDPRILRVHRREPPAELLVDRVLVDAPCSELGPLRRGPDVRFRLEPATFTALPSLQRSLLEKALKHLRPGGRLVYATCTFRREEGEEVALAFEAANAAQLTRHRLGEGWLDPSLVTPEGFFRSFPHRHGTDGFFAAVWTRL